MYLVICTYFTDNGHGRLTCIVMVNEDHTENAVSRNLNFYEKKKEYKRSK
jgi:hypothetical protein